MPKASQSPTTFSPWSRFTPLDQESLEDLVQFEEAVTAVKEHSNKRRSAKLRKKNAATNKALRELASCGLSDAANARIEEWIADSEVPPPGRFKADFELSSIPTNELCVHAQELLHELTRRGFDGDFDAVTEIAEIAGSSTLNITAFEFQFPEQIRTIARKSAFWPMMRRDSRDNIRFQNERLDRLEVGSDLRTHRCKFRERKGPDRNYAGREWAKRAVRTIEETRRRLIVASQNKMLTLPVMESCNLIPTEQPEWLKPDRLPPFPFSEESINAWVPLVREMIRTDTPDFHEHPDWTDLRRSMEAAGRDTKGAIQCKILDRICHALKQLAPQP